MEYNKNEYSLSIRFSSDGFSLSVLDGVGAVLMRRTVSAPLFQMSKAELVNLLDNELEVDPADYAQMSLVVETDHYEFVPASLFELKNIDDYFYFRHPRDERSLVLFNRVAQWEGVDVFSVPADLHEALADFFPDVMPVHQVAFFLSKRLKKGAQQVSVWLRPNCLDVVVVKDSRLHLVNSFNYRAVEDVVYFVLNCFEQFGLNVEKTPVELYQRERNTEYKEALSQYVKHCGIKEQLTVNNANL